MSLLSTRCCHKDNVILHVPTAALAATRPQSFCHLQALLKVTHFWTQGLVLAPDLTNSRALARSLLQATPFVTPVTQEVRPCACQEGHGSCSSTATKHSHSPSTRAGEVHHSFPNLGCLLQSSPGILSDHCTKQWGPGTSVPPSCRLTAGGTNPCGSAPHRAGVLDHDTTDMWGWVILRCGAGWCTA